MSLRGSDDAAPVHMLLLRCFLCVLQQVNLAFERFAQISERSVGIHVTLLQSKITEAEASVRGYALSSVNTTRAKPQQQGLASELEMQVTHQ